MTDIPVTENHRKQAEAQIRAEIEIESVTYGLFKFISTERAKLLATQETLADRTEDFLQLLKDKQESLDEWEKIATDRQEECERLRNALISLGYEHGCTPGSDEEEDALMMCRPCLDAIALIPRVTPHAP